MSDKNDKDKKDNKCTPQVDDIWGDQYSENESEDDEFASEFDAFKLDEKDNSIPNKDDTKATINVADNKEQSSNDIDKALDDLCNYYEPSATDKYYMEQERKKEESQKEEETKLDLKKTTEQAKRDAELEEKRKKREKKNKKFQKKNNNCSKNKLYSDKYDKYADEYYDKYND